MRISIKIAAVLVTCLGSMSAHARVVVEDNASSHVAFGEMRAAAAPGAEDAYIYCDMSGSVMSCGASDGFGHSAWCFTEDPNLKRLFPSLGRTSNLWFSFSPTNGLCLGLSVYNTSRQFGALSPAAAKPSHPPYVDLTYRYAYGSMNSPIDDASTEGVSCTAADSYVECSITDGNAITARCVSDHDSPSQTLADMRLAVMGMNESSFVSFRWEGDLPSACLDLYVGNVSQYLQ